MEPRSLPLGVQLICGRVEVMLNHCANMLGRSTVYLSGETKDELDQMAGTLREMSNYLKELRR